MQRSAGSMSMVRRSQEARTELSASQARLWLLIEAMMTDTQTLLVNGFPSLSFRQPVCLEE